MSTAEPKLIARMEGHSLPILHVTQLIHVSRKEWDCPLQTPAAPAVILTQLIEIRWKALGSQLCLCAQPSPFYQTWSGARVSFRCLRQEGNAYWDFNNACFLCSLRQEATTEVENAWGLIKPPDSAAKSRLIQGSSPSWRASGAGCLHVLILAQCCGEQPSSAGSPEEVTLMFQVNMSRGLTPTPPPSPVYCRQALNNSVPAEMVYS